MAPTPTAAPLLLPFAGQRRNYADAAGASTISPLAQAQATPSSTSTSASATTTTSVGGSVGNGIGWGWGGSGNGGNGSAFGSSWVTWISIIIVAGVLIALLFSRWFFIRKAYRDTPNCTSRTLLRAYFVPQKGYHVPLLRIHIAGPPPRAPTEPPPSYYETTGRRRRRRHRETVGDTLGPGGARVGERDMDDGFDDDGEEEGDEVDAAERGEGRTRARAPAELPPYFVDIGLPSYKAGEEGAAEAEAERIRNLAAVAGETGAGGEVVEMLTASQYEAASRGARAGATTTDDAAQAGEGGDDSPTYPPSAHILPPSVPLPTSSVSRPTPQRSSTGRSLGGIGTNFLSSLPAFMRSPTAESHPHPHPHSHDQDAAQPRPSSSAETLDSSSSSSSASDDRASTSTSHHHPGVKRNASTESGSTGETKVVPLGGSSSADKVEKQEEERREEAEAGDGGEMEMQELRRPGAPREDEGAEGERR